MAASIRALAKRPALLAAALLLTGCEVVTYSGPAPAATAPAPRAMALDGRAQSQFRKVVARVEPVAEQICRERRPDLNCDYRITIDPNPRQPANAFQSRDPSGRPMIVFTQALIREAGNTDELAFVLGHEAAHHIANHLPRTQTNATVGAVLGGILASVAGAGDQLVRSATDLGGFVGSRRYSVEYELEADRIGTRIAQRAGYDPVRGAAFFDRIPDPGNGFLASHPPNAQRIRTVRRAAGR